MTVTDILAVFAVAAIAFALGWLIARLRAQKLITELTTTLELERRQAVDKLAEIEKTFALLSSEALRQNSKSFLQLAQETLKQFHVQARGDLDLKEKAVESMVRPIREALEKTEQQVRLMEKERKEAYGALHQTLETMTQTRSEEHTSEL